MTATTTLSASTIIENVFKDFYDVIVAIGGIFSSKVYPTFPDVKLDDTADYPIVVIDSPEISWDQFTFGKNVLDGTISVTIYTTTAKDADQYASDVHFQIESEKDTLASLGMRQIKLELTNSDMVKDGEIKVFIKSLNFAYKFYFNKTFAY